MRRFMLSLCAAIALAFGCQAAQGSEGVGEVVKLLKSGVDEDVLMAYVESNNVIYDLSYDEVILLHDVGVPSKVIARMMTIGKERRDKQAAGQLGAVQPPPSDPQPVAVQPADPATPAPVYDYAPPPDTTAPVAQPQPAPEPVQAVYYENMPSAPVVVTETPTVSFFYESLLPYGTWVELPSYGWVWRPTVARDPSWRPYLSNGGWIWTDHGWFWQSNYSWGWAPFHYGRWAFDGRFGWVWLPDTTWGPAWVNWRHSESHVGWAPLPPAAHFEAGIGFSFHSKKVDVDFSFGLGERDYAFVTLEHFSEPNLHTFAVAPAQAPAIYQQTTIINNTYVYNDNRIINNGISPQVIQKSTGRQYAVVKIADAQATTGQAIPKTVVASGQISIYRPQIKVAATIETPVTIAERNKATVQKVQVTQVTTTTKTTTTSTPNAIILKPVDPVIVTKDPKHTPIQTPPVQTYTPPVVVQQPPKDPVVVTKSKDPVIVSKDPVIVDTKDPKTKGKDPVVVTKDPVIVDTKDPKTKGKDPVVTPQPQRKLTAKELKDLNDQIQDLEDKKAKERNPGKIQNLQKQIDDLKAIRGY